MAGHGVNRSASERRVMGRVVPFDAFELRRQERQTGQRFCRCGSCGKLMPESENPCGTGRALWDTCPDCLLLERGTEHDGRLER